MKHPYQCTAVVSRTQSQGLNILLAACGPKLLALDLISGKVAAEWPSTTNSNRHAEGTEDGERPAKKQKTSDGSVTSSVITILRVAPDGEHAVVVTDDKVVRVFHVKPDGILEDLSQRCMPKRPCAIDILPENNAILCGDKFGDVYSLPLHQGERDINPHVIEKVEAARSGKSNFVPTANDLTVHTKRNRRALEAQRSQKNFTAKKEPLAFEHQLLLGHVSMLTDMRYASRSVGSKRRGYIITTDRDEHIRISRGPPQSFVIEGFCLAHEEFVSKICLIPDTDLLVSGGGDDWLGVWDWADYKLVSKISLRPLVERSGCSGASGQQIAVSGLWAGEIPLKVTVVALEKLPVLFIIPLASLLGDGDRHLGDQVGVSFITLDGNPIDVTWVGDTMIVSQDVRNDAHPRLLAFQFNQSSNEGVTNNPLVARRLQKDHEATISLNILNDLANETAVSAKALDELLYSVNNLRKRRDVDADIENDEDGETFDE